MSKTNTKAATPAPGPAAPPATGAVPVETASAAPKGLLNIGEIIARSISDPNGTPAATLPPPAPAPTEPSGTDPADVADTADTDPAAGPSIDDPAMDTEDTPDPADPAPEPPRRDGRQKRIDKLTARNAQLEAELESLRTRLEAGSADPSGTGDDPADDTLSTPRRPAAPSTGGNPLANVTTLEDLATREAEANQVIDWADQQMITLRRSPETVARHLKSLNLLAVEPDEATREDIEAALLSVRSNAERTIRVHAPQRREYIAAAQHYDRAAATEFPWWKDKKSAEYGLAQRVLREWGDGVKQMPNWRMMVGVHVEGLRAIEARRKSRAGQAPASTAPRAIAPRLPGIGANPAATRGHVDKRGDAMRKVAEGKPGAVREYFASTLAN